MRHSPGRASSDALLPCRGSFGHAGWWKDKAAGSVDLGWIARLPDRLLPPRVAPKPGRGIA